MDPAYSSRPLGIQIIHIHIYSRILVSCCGLALFFSSTSLIHIKIYFYWSVALPAKSSPLCCAPEKKDLRGKQNMRFEVRTFHGSCQACQWREPSLVHPDCPRTISLPRASGYFNVIKVFAYENWSFRTLLLETMMQRVHQVVVLVALWTQYNYRIFSRQLCCKRSY